MRRIKYYCNDCKNEFVLECNKIMSETNHCMRCGSKNIEKIKTYKGKYEELKMITVEKINEKVYELVLVFDDDCDIHVAIDNTDNDVTNKMTDDVMEAFLETGKLNFNDICMIHNLVKGLIERVI